MLKKIFMCGAALIFMSTAALADTCLSPTDVMTKLIIATTTAAPQYSDYKPTMITISDQETIKTFFEHLTNITGSIPFKVTDVSKIVIYQGNDDEKYTSYIGFFDAHDCKFQGTMLQSVELKQLLKEANVGEGA